jgi:hypothetical protein
MLARKVVLRLGVLQDFLKTIEPHASRLFIDGETQMPGAQAGWTEVLLKQRRSAKEKDEIHGDLVGSGGHVREEQVPDRGAFELAVKILEHPVNVFFPHKLVYFFARPVALGRAVGGCICPRQPNVNRIVLDIKVKMQRGVENL